MMAKIGLGFSQRKATTVPEVELIANRAAVLAILRASVEHAGARIDPNALIAAVVRRHAADLMAAPDQLRDHGGGNAALGVDRPTIAVSRLARRRGRADVLDARRLPR